jgi:Ca2+-binding RTX toxin-like protein
MPFIKGSAVAGGVVRLYTNPACAEPRASEGLSAAFASPGIQTSVLNDATTTIYATVTNSVGVTSLCSTSSLTYVEDSTSPETTIDSGPDATVAAGGTVRFEFSSNEPGSHFECHLHDAGFQPCSSPATFPARPTGSSASSATLQVRAIDRAGNEDASPAARSYAIGAASTTPPPIALRTGCALRVVAISGTSAANTINGTARSDILLGKAGNDLLRGLAGNDCLYGEAGNDRLRGGAGSDRLFGGPGADRLEGESGSDRMTGAAGNDRLTDRSGRDRFSGGAGNDTIDARDTSLVGRHVRDTVTCGPGRDRVLADRSDVVARDCERITRR